MARGDLVLYRSSGSTYDNMIAWATKGPFVHAEILMDATRTIGAQHNGIQYGFLPMDKSRYEIVPVSRYVKPLHIEAALSWAKEHLGQPYGWTDIFYQALKTLIPGEPFELSEQGHWDCSDFATRYLQQLGAPLPDAYADPNRVTPNDLARLFKVPPFDQPQPQPQGNAS